MYMRVPGLGLIPNWQMSMDPAINPKLNPFVQYPEGMNQEAIQPIGSTWGPQYANTLQGPFDSWAFTNRKILVGGTVVVLGAGILAALVALLK